MDSLTITLLTGVITGAFGAGYFLYGKTTGMVMPMVCGAILCVYPYLTDDVTILVGAGVTLIVLPFVVRI